MKSALQEIKNTLNFEATASNILIHSDEYDIAELILPAREKIYYERCAFIISRMPIEFIIKHASDLMEWFQDLNWPGCSIIFNSLCQLPKGILIEALKEAYTLATNTNDDEWIYNLHECFDTYIDEVGFT